MEFTSTIITRTEDGEVIRDYAYISEEGFLLIIALTSKGTLFESCVLSNWEFQLS